MTMAGFNDDTAEYIILAFYPGEKDFEVLGVEEVGI